MKRSLIYNGLEEFVHYWVMSLWLVSTYRWQTRMTSVNWAVFAAPCLMFLDHNWDQRWRSISLADAANRRNIPPFGFSFFRVSYHKKKQTHFLIKYCESKYLSSLAYKRSYRNVVTLQHLLKISLQLFHKPFSYMQWFFCILYCNFSIPQSLGIFTYIYSSQIYLRFLYVLQFL